MSEKTCKTCKTCKHWGQYRIGPANQDSQANLDEDIECGHGFDLCGRIVHDYYLFASGLCVPQKDNAVGNRLYPLVIREPAVVQDTDNRSICTALLTKEDFGCTLWESKE